MRVTGGETENFQDAMQSLGIAQSADQAGSALGAFWSPNSLDPRNQTRSSARSAYYDGFAADPAAGTSGPAEAKGRHGRHRRKNLHALTGAHVTRLLTHTSANGSVSIAGAEYSEDGGQTAARRRVRASREYILSAGSVHDPQILQLSGNHPPRTTNHSFTHQLSPAYHLLSPALTRSLLHSLTHLFTHSLTCSLAHSGWQGSAPRNCWTDSASR